MKLISILILLMLSHCAHGQEDRRFFIDEWISENDLSVFLFSDGTYYMETSEFWTDDMVYTRVLSYGKFKEVGDMMTCYDEIGLFKLHIKISNDTLRFLRTPDFLKRVELHFASVSREKESICVGIDSSRTRKSIEEEIQKGIHRQDSFFVFTKGKYKHISHAFELRFHKEGVYRFSFKGELISRGIWRKKGSLVELEDLVLKSKFYLTKSGDYSLDAVILPFGAFEKFTYDPDWWEIDK